MLRVRRGAFPLVKAEARQHASPVSIAIFDGFLVVNRRSVCKIPAGSTIRSAHCLGGTGLLVVLSKGLIPFVSLGTIGSHFTTPMHFESADLLYVTRQVHLQKRNHQVPFVLSGGELHMCPGLVAIVPGLRLLLLGKPNVAIMPSICAHLSSMLAMTRAPNPATSIENPPEHDVAMYVEELCSRGHTELSSLLDGGKEYIDEHKLHALEILCDVNIAHCLNL